MTLNLDDLEAKAKAATPGPWECSEVRTQCGRAFRIGSGEMLEAGKGCCIIYDDYPGNPENERKANAAHIAAANPATVLELIRRFRELEAEKARARNEALEEAAKVADDRADTYAHFANKHEGSPIGDSHTMRCGAASAVAAAIRAMITKE